MEKNEKQDLHTGVSLPHASSSDLMGRQSVRTTFKLTERTIDTVSIVATHLGIKQKSLFDHLIEDIQALCSIAGEIEHSEFKKQHRIQKTYVISRKSLSSLDKVSKDYNTPRDALVEYSVQRLLPIVNSEREKHRQRKEILHEFLDYVNEGKRILNQSKAMLGEDDPVYAKLESAMAVCESVYEQIESFIEKGKIIEEFIQDNL